MRIPPHTDSYQVLLLQAADEGRGQVLFGESLNRARKAALPFMESEIFPDIYFEHPLIGNPFIDVTILYGKLKPGTRIESPAAGEHGAMLDWFVGEREKHEEISFGFELDTKKDPLPMAAIHFQPRTHTDLVRPFCEAIGEPERADLYLSLSERMPENWPLSFFGMFRGRPNFPLRVCGYLDNNEKQACSEDPGRLASVFEAIGFSTYDDAMLTQISTLMAAVPQTVDFQFDIFPDGHLGPTFAIDAQFSIEQPEAVRATFTDGAGAHVMGLLEKWGVADGRWRQAIESAFARAVPVELDDGDIGRFAFTLMPQWAKARWTDCTLQPAKLYHLAHANLLEGKADEAEPASHDEAKPAS